MPANRQSSSIMGGLFAFCLIGNIVIIRTAYTGHPNLYWALLLTVPLLLITAVRKPRKTLKTRKTLSKIRRFPPARQTSPTREAPPAPQPSQDRHSFRH